MLLVVTIVRKGSPAVTFISGTQAAWQGGFSAQVAGNLFLLEIVAFVLHVENRHAGDKKGETRAGASAATGINSEATKSKYVSFAFPPFFLLHLSPVYSSGSRAPGK